jgi:DNA-nicking Smr family endonuclease
MIKKTNNTEFSKLLSDVQPLLNERIKPHRPPIKPIPTQRIADDRLVLDQLLVCDPEEASFLSGDELSYLKNGYPQKLLKRLRRGSYAIEDEFDLHGLTLEQAKKHVRRFIADCECDRLGAVRIIHGKGLSSPGREPVLKRHILGWLKKMDAVIAVSSATPRDGGTGAIYVLLKRK